MMQRNIESELEISFPICVSLFVKATFPTQEISCGERERERDPPLALEVLFLLLI